MKGIIIFYVNFHLDYQQDVQQCINMILKVNQQVFEKIRKDNNYEIMVVPTTKEACRVEKMEMDKPFPRYASRPQFNPVDIGKVIDKPDVKECADKDDEIPSESKE